MSNQLNTNIVYLMFGVIIGCVVSNDSYTKSLEGIYERQASLALVAKQSINPNIVYDASYSVIRYPYGDVDRSKGVCSDVVVRAYRKIGVDLQSLIFSDMMQNYDDYPKLYNQIKPDPNIDHRRVPNLDIFFKKYGLELPLNSDFKEGDIIVWQYHKVPDHIAIVTSVEPDGVTYVHNRGRGLEYGHCYSCSKLVGHYRF